MLLFTDRLRRDACVVRSIEEVRRVQTLIEEGMNDCEIARETGIPRRTIRDWRHGKVPRGGSSGEERTCPKCGHMEHDFAALPVTEYAYLLGLYLGDGTISKARRGVFKLRITLDMRYPGIIEGCPSAMSAVCPSSKVKHGRVIA